MVRTAGGGGGIVVVGLVQSGAIRAGGGLRGGRALGAGGRGEER